MIYDEIIKKVKLITMCDEFNMHYISPNARFPENKKCSQCGKILNINCHYYEDDIYTYVNLLYRAINKKPIIKFIRNMNPSKNKAINPMDLMSIGEEFFKNFYKNVDKSQDIIIVSSLFGYVDNSIGIQKTQEIILNKFFEFEIFPIINLTKYTIDVDPNCQSYLVRQKRWDKYQIEALGGKRISQISKHVYHKTSYFSFDGNFMNNYLSSIIDKDPEEALSIALISGMPKEFIEPDILNKLENYKKNKR